MTHEGGEGGSKIFLIYLFLIIQWRNTQIRHCPRVYIYLSIHDAYIYIYIYVCIYVYISIGRCIAI